MSSKYTMNQQIQGVGAKSLSVIPSKFTAHLKKDWKKTLGHMYGHNMMQETHKVIGKPNIPGMGKYETGKKKGQPRKIRFRKCRSAGKAIVSRVKDSDPIGFRYMYGSPLPLWDVGSNFTVEMGFKARGSKKNATVDQENGFDSFMRHYTKQTIPKFANRKNVPREVTRKFREDWEKMPKKISGFNITEGYGKWLENKWGYKFKVSHKETYHPSLQIAFERQEKKFGRTLQKWISQNIQRVVNISMGEV